MTDVPKDQAAEAVRIAEAHMATHNYAHGPCIGVKRLPGKTGTRWEVEFAWQGYTTHAKTRDPSSIEVIVDPESGSVKTIMESWGDRW